MSKLPYFEIFIRRAFLPASQRPYTVVFFDTLVPDEEMEIKLFDLISAEEVGQLMGGN